MRVLMCHDSPEGVTKCAVTQLTGAIILRGKGATFTLTQLFRPPYLESQINKCERCIHGIHVAPMGMLA